MNDEVGKYESGISEDAGLTGWQCPFGIAYAAAA